MVALRKTQGVLNGFWQTSELAYGYLLSHSDTVFADKRRPTIEVLGHIESQVWYPNSKGHMKLDRPIGDTLQAVRNNTVHVYRATLLSYYSAFETYLEQRVRPLVTRGRSWAPFVKSLALPVLMPGEFPLRLNTLLRADFCRHIRNDIVHEPFTVPTSLDDSDVLRWKKLLQDDIDHAVWPAAEAAAEVEHAARWVVGGAGMKVAEARRQGKRLPVEHFYMLFTFTNLDNLAFEIEEALQPKNDRAGGSVSRAAKDVRRTDLILDVKHR
jgi:hypothetical protein